MLSHTNEREKGEERERKGKETRWKEGRERERETERKTSEHRQMGVGEISTQLCPCPEMVPHTVPVSLALSFPTCSKEPWLLGACRHR